MKDQEFRILCERRIGHPVDAACRARFETANGTRAYALALTAGWLWWLEIYRWPLRIGRVLSYQPLHGLVAHTSYHRGRHHVELSWPVAGVLLIGVLQGKQAEDFDGKLTAALFNQSTARTST